MTEIADPNRAEAAADLMVEDLIQKVGDRVRKAREMKGLPRRVISEMSGVSPRYLAQLEAGEGNISIGLLKRVAIALDQRLDWFVADEEPLPPDVRKVAELYHGAPVATRERVLDLLNAAARMDQRARRIGLIGFRGAGKSTLGAMVGRTLGLPFVELDWEIEADAGMAVAEVLALYGQDGYRRFEAQAIDRVIAAHEAVVLAAEGGAIAVPAVGETLLAHFHTIWLRASAEDHLARVRAQGGPRSTPDTPEAVERLKCALQGREPLYARAEAMIDTSGKGLDDAHDELVALIGAQGFLKSR